MAKSSTMLQKIWERHVVHREAGAPDVLYIDLHLVHEVTSPQAFAALREKGLQVRRPESTLATIDHSTPTTHQSLEGVDEMAANQVNQMINNCKSFGVPLLDLNNRRRGIVHVVGPELGATQPGMTIVCGDSHTATHGALGALAFGIGTSEVEHVLATQCLLQYPPKNMLVNFEGRLAERVTAKDMILFLISEMGVSGGTGYVIEYAGPAVRALDMDGRMTLCNMTIEAGARAGMVAPDDTTYEYLAGKVFSPEGLSWDSALAQWKNLPSDPGSTYDKSITLDISHLEPMITYGTNPGMVVSINQAVPNPSHEKDEQKRLLMEKALKYMDLVPGESMLGHPIDVVFIGSCTNSRLSDLRQAAEIFKNRRVAKGVRTLVVPGSENIRRQAEAEGLDLVFKGAGAEWRYSGCSMCIGMNGDQLQPGQYAVSTSNRNFEGRQGPGGRTFLASPLTAAASAIQGCVADPRVI
jgi:3-isopropylmalate/(R)-2-methylmalate dehydratase large subunit